MIETLVNFIFSVRYGHKKKVIKWVGIIVTLSGWAVTTDAWDTKLGTFTCHTLGCFTFACLKKFCNVKGRNFR